MERMERKLEELFADVAMAEGQDFPPPLEELDEAVRDFECSFVDVAFAEAGDFTVSACTPHH